MSENVVIKRRKQSYDTSKVEAAFELIDSEEAAALVDGLQAAEVISRGVADSFKLLFGALVTAGKIQNNPGNRALFGKTQIIIANLLQNSIALGIQEGERRAMEKLAKGD